MNQEDKLALLALLAEHLTRPAALARELLERKSPCELAKSAAWRPKVRAWREAERCCYALELLDIACLGINELPARFTRPNPKPPALFVRGNANVLARPAVAIVGSRQASAGPLKWAAEQARTCVAQEWVIASGGARGIDAAAHRAALAAEGETVVYLGVPADRIYPASHRRLFSRILEKNGALVSEHPPFAATGPWCHAARNRLIAAHASHVIVAEAAERSGSLGTAAYARRLAVPVWVPPADVGGEQSGLSILLAEHGARVLAPQCGCDAGPRALQDASAGG